MNEQDKDTLKRKIGLRIKRLRMQKGWSQKTAANKLELSPAGVGCMERGEIDISITRLAEIAEVFEIDLEDLLGENGKVVLSFNGDYTTGCSNNYKTNLTSNELQHELEKSLLVQQAQEKEIGYLKEENARLKEMLEWFKEKDKQT